MLAFNLIIEILKGKGKRFTKLAEDNGILFWGDLNVYAVIVATTSLLYLDLTAKQKIQATKALINIAVWGKFQYTDGTLNSHALKIAMNVQTNDIQSVCTNVIWKLDTTEIAINLINQKSRKSPLTNTFKEMLENIIINNTTLK